jgi:hypothetical protein
MATTPPSHASVPYAVSPGKNGQSMNGTAPTTPASSSNTRCAFGASRSRTLSITSHELFHAWNVKRMMPAKFSPYDYWTETPTRLLWAMEGLTSYYGELTLVRSGLWSIDRYLRHLGKEIQTLEALPARLHLPLAQASFDASTRHDDFPFFQMRDSLPTTPARWRRSSGSGSAPAAMPAAATAACRTVR